MRVHDLVLYLDEFAPLQLAEDWDNVGLLVGDRQRSVERVMTCLTVTAESVAEAVASRAELIITHHPLPFRPLPRITTDTTVGRLLWDLIRAEISVYSPHTAFDSAAGGINQQLAEGLQLLEIRPLVPSDKLPAGTGSGRCGTLPAPGTLDAVAQRLRQFLAVPRLQRVGSREQPVTRVAIACGAAGQFLDAACTAGCELLITGETNFHTCLEAKARGIALLLVGHYASERFAVETLAQQLSQRFPQLYVWPSCQETDPLEE